MTRIAELTDTEAMHLGAWQARLSRALEAVTGYVKTYIAQFAEAPGFSHVHLHIVPRYADLAENLTGPRIFSLIGKNDSDALSPAEMDAVAAKLCDRLAHPPAQ